MNIPAFKEHQKICKECAWIPEGYTGQECDDGRRIIHESPEWKALGDAYKNHINEAVDNLKYVKGRNLNEIQTGVRKRVDDG